MLDIITKYLDRYDYSRKHRVGTFCTGWSWLRSGFRPLGIPNPQSVNTHTHTGLSHGVIVERQG